MKKELVTLYRTDTVARCSLLSAVTDNNNTTTTTITPSTAITIITTIIITTIIITTMGAGATARRPSPIYIPDAAGVRL